MSVVSFAEFIAAVKPRNRSSQYHILAAMYVLGAGVSPVTVRQIDDLLKGHLPKSKLPADIDGSLRQYVGLVESRKTKPVTWGLTTVGLDRLRDKSGL